MVVNLPFWKPPPFLFHGFYKKNHDPLSHSGDQRALFSDLFCVHFWEPWGISVSGGDALLSPLAVRYLLSDWRDDGWQQGRASRTLLMRFKQGQVFYMQCAYLWLTACMSQCDPSHQTLARDMSQSTYHSDMNGWAPPLILFFTAGGPGAVGLDRDLGSLWNRRNSHTLTFHRSITCHCCHWKLFFLLTVLRLAWVFRHFCNTLSWGKHFRSQWRI